MLKHLGLCYSNIIKCANIGPNKTWNTFVHAMGYRYQRRLMYQGRWHETRDLIHRWPLNVVLPQQSGLPLLACQPSQWMTKTRTHTHMSHELRLSQISQTTNIHTHMLHELWLSQVSSQQTNKYCFLITAIIHTTTNLRSAMVYITKICSNDNAFKPPQESVLRPRLLQMCNSTRDSFDILQWKSFKMVLISSPTLKKTCLEHNIKLNPQSVKLRCIKALIILCYWH